MVGIKPLKPGLDFSVSCLALTILYGHHDRVIVDDPKSLARTKTQIIPYRLGLVDMPSTRTNLYKGEFVDTTQVSLSTTLQIGISYRWLHDQPSSFRDHPNNSVTVLLLYTALRSFMLFL